MDRFDKFTDRARKVLTLAQDEAQRFNHNYIGTEHLLLGLVREGEGVAARVLENMNVELPKVRAAMHLDTVVTQVDVDAFITYPQMMQASRTFQLTRRGEHGVHVVEGPDLIHGLAWAASLDHARVIEPSLSAIRAEREQWNDANNTLALRPGEVITYERNVATNEILAAAGITVHTIPSYELPRGRGGPRCMSCPVVRRALP